MADSPPLTVLPASSAVLRDSFLRDIRLAAIDTGLTAEPPTEPGTDWYLLAESISRIVLIGLANQSLADQDRSVLTATGQALERERIARGVPEVSAAGATGKIVPTIFGTTTITNGQPFSLPNGLHGVVVGSYVNPLQGDEIDVEMIDVGEATNLAGGGVVRFSGPPANVAVEAKVSNGTPLTGGTDAELDGRKRARILQTMRTRPAGGNWAHLREKGLATLGSLQDVYVYPALGGPSSVKIVPVKDFDVAASDFSRSVSSAALQTIRGALFAAFPLDVQIIVQAAADQPADFAIQATIPDSVLVGGNGQGWVDLAPWPRLVGGDGGNVAVTSTGNAELQLTIDANTPLAPVDGQTTIAWWSSVDRRFYTALVVSHAGSTGAWICNLDRPLRGRTGAGPQAGDYISPAAQNLTKYGETWLSMFRALGPGENTSDTNRLPRSRRRPFATLEDPSSLNATSLLTLVAKHPEITSVVFSYAPVTAPTVPGSVDTAPNVLTPRRFGIYPQ